MAASPGRSRSAWSSVLADREYAALWLAYALSLAGDQLARVALAVLVFDATGSAVATALAYAVTFLPWLVGGPLLAGLGDRYPRRTVLVACDTLAAGLLTAMALPGLSLVALGALLFLVVTVAAPFTAARSALVRDIFPDDDRYAAAVALSAVTIQLAQVVGFAVGGLLVATLGPREALLVDGVTFALSALLVRLRVRHRGAPVAAAGRRHWADVRAGARLVFGDRKLRVLTLFAWLAAFHVHSVPSGVVVPYAAERGAGPLAVGLLLAAAGLGSGLAMVALTRVPAARRLPLMTPLAILAAAALIPCLLDPPLPVVGLLWIVAGLGTGYQLAANVAFVAAVPAERRAQAFGMVSAGLAVGQGIGVVAAGALAEVADPAVVVGAAGVAGLVAVLALLATPSARLVLAGPG
ncbi:MAG: MFS transporter [Mycobacteriales bacterium]